MLLKQLMFGVNFTDLLLSPCLFPECLKKPVLMERWVLPAQNLRSVRRVGQLKLHQHAQQPLSCQHPDPQRCRHTNFNVNANKPHRSVFCHCANTVMTFGRFLRQHEWNLDDIFMYISKSRVQEENILLQLKTWASAGPVQNTDKTFVFNVKIHH